MTDSSLNIRRSLGIMNGRVIWNTSIFGPYGATAKLKITKRLPSTAMIYCGEFCLNACCGSKAMKSNRILSCYSIFHVQLPLC